MFSQIALCLRICANSTVLFFIGVLNTTSLFAAENNATVDIVNQENLPSSFTKYFFSETHFLNISENPLLSLVESLLVLVAVFLVIYGLWYIKKPKEITHSGPYFKLLNLNEQSPLISIKAEMHTFEFLSKIQTSNKYRLSANLNRVILTPHQNTFLLEDKNYKNALLINRRRSHRTLLCDNDVLDVGEMILLYCNGDVPVSDAQQLSRAELHLPISGIKPKGPLQKGTPILTLSGSQHEIPLVRNMNTLGTSNFNDVTVVSNEVALRHAKIYKVGQSWKIQNIMPHETTTVNGRRIDERFLQDGDEIAIGDIFFKFRISKVQLKMLLKPKAQTVKKSVKI